MSKFLTGLLFGVGVGLLLAPEKGEDTRESIADTAEDWKNKFNKLVGKAGAHVDDVKKMLAGEISGLSDDAKSRINTILQEAGDKAKDLGDKAKDAGDKAKDKTNDMQKDQFKPI